MKRIMSRNRGIMKKGVVVCAAIATIFLYTTSAYAEEITQEEGFQEEIVEEEITPTPVQEDSTQAEETVMSEQENTQTQAVVASEQIKPAISGEAPSVSDYVIPDLQLRKIVNKALGKKGDEIETYSASIEELQNYDFYMLDIVASGEPDNYLQIDSFEGIQYLTKLKELYMIRVITPEESLIYISKLTSLKRLSINTTLFSGNDTTTTLINRRINGVSMGASYKLPIDNDVDISPLGNLTNLTLFAFTANGIQEFGPYTTSSRTTFRMSGLSKLVNVENIDFEKIPNTDDENFTFLSSLTKLKKLVIVDSIGLTSVDAIATLPNLTYLNISGTRVTDFTPIVDKPYFSNTIEMSYDFGSQFYTTTEDGKHILSLDTGIKFGSEVTNISFTTMSIFSGKFDIDNYSATDTLKIDFEVKDPVAYKVLNYVTGEYDIQKYGFLVGFQVTLANGKTITYGSTYVDVGKVITFDHNYKGSTPTIQKLDPYALISAPTITRAGYAFEGWYVDAACTTPFDFTTLVMMNTTLYAKWDKLPDPVPTPDPDPTPKPSEKPKDDEWVSVTTRDLKNGMVNTGDATNTTNYLMLSIISMSVIVVGGIVVAYRKKQTEEEIK